MRSMTFASGHPRRPSKCSVSSSIRFVSFARLRSPWCTSAPTTLTTTLSTRNPREDLSPPRVQHSPHAERGRFVDTNEGNPPLRCCKRYCQFLICTPPIIHTLLPPWPAIAASSATRLIFAPLYHALAETTLFGFSKSGIRINEDFTRSLLLGPKGPQPYPSFSLSGVGFVVSIRAKPGARFDLLYQVDRYSEALTAGSPPSCFRELTYSEVRLLLAGASFTEGHALEFRGCWAVAGSSGPASYLARPQSLNRKLSQKPSFLGACVGLL